MIIQNKIALITGAAKGLGKSFAHALLRKGASGACLVDFDKSQLSITVNELQKLYGEEKVCSFTADVCNVQQLEGAFNHVKQKYGKLHIVCNNAGIGDEDNPDKTFAVNLFAVYRGTMLGIQHMRRDVVGSEGGTIINVASMAGLNAISFAPVYTATKHAVVGLSRAMGNDYHFSKCGIRINCLCPSFTDTDLVKPLVGPKQPAAMKQFLDKFPLNSVEVTANAFMQLVEDDSKNGDILQVLPGNVIAYKIYHPLSRL